MVAAQSVLSVHQVSEAFTAKPVFSGLSMIIQDAEHVGLIGANGTGKSTLLQIMAGRLMPTKANAWWRAMPTSALSPSRSLR